MKKLTFKDIKNLTEDRFSLRDVCIANSGKDLKTLTENYNVIGFCRHDSDYYDADTSSYLYRVYVQLNGRNQTVADDSYCISLDYEYNTEYIGCDVYLNKDNDFSLDAPPKEAEEFVNNVLECFRQEDIK